MKTRRETPLDAAQMSVLHDDGQTRSWLLPLRLAAGRRLPAHVHDSPEQCPAETGDLWPDNRRYIVGNCQYAAAGSRHEQMRSDGGRLRRARSASSQRGAVPCARP